MTAQEAINAIRAIVNDTPPTLSFSVAGTPCSVSYDDLRLVPRPWLEDLIPLLAKLV